MSLNILKSLVCGVIVAQISATAVAATKAGQTLASAEIVKCDAAKTSTDVNAHGTCLIAANTKIITRMHTAEVKIARLYAACEVKFKGFKAAAGLASWCKSEGASRKGVVATIEKTLEYQKALEVAFQKPVNEANRASKAAEQIASIKNNAEYVIASETQLTTSESSIRKSYKAVTPKKFVY